MSDFAKDTDDLISRQAAIDGIHDAWINGAYYTETINTLKRLPSAQQWIPCSERLPNPNEFNGNVIKYYLVQNVFGDMLVCNWNGTDWGIIYSNEFEMPEDVVAWMPLPEPYKGKDHETD